MKLLKVFLVVYTQKTSLCNVKAICLFFVYIHDTAADSWTDDRRTARRTDGRTEDSMTVGLHDGQMVVVVVGAAVFSQVTGAAKLAVDMARNTRWMDRRMD